MNNIEPQPQNAANETQVRKFDRKAKDRLEQETDDLRFVMGTPAGRRVMWGLITKAGVYKTVWEPSAKIHYNAGRQDFGHELMALLLKADESLYLAMSAEARGATNV